jgi:hypothetical protein
MKIIYIWFFTLLALVTTSFSSFAIDNKDCYRDSGGSKHYNLNYSINMGDVLASTPPGTVVGTITLSSAKITCSSSKFEWRLQLSPKATAIAGDDTTCLTNIPGVGIQYIDYNNRKMQCNSWDAIFSVGSFTDSKTIPDRLVIARIVRLKSALANNGTYALNFNATLLAHYYGSTNSTDWGELVLSGQNIINISTYNSTIFFPTSSFSTPIINLDFSHRPGSQKNVSGRASLDMCLYDGNNSSSSRVSLRFQDDGVSGRPTGQFSLYLEGKDKSKAENRLDYQVSVLNPTTGAQQNVVNGSEIIWDGVNQRNMQRQVILPGIPGVSLCVPAPITLATLPFILADKTAGRYTGTLRIIYTPSTQTAQ